jgi:hypothetical protein
MQNINFQGITFTPNEALSPIPIEVLESVEAQLGFIFPEDYREFIMTVGAGETAFHLGIWPPQGILEVDMRSADGDDIPFHPSDRSQWFILQHWQYW